MQSRKKHSSQRQQVAPDDDEQPYRKEKSGRKKALAVTGGQAAQSCPSTEAVDGHGSDQALLRRGERDSDQTQQSNVAKRVRTIH